MFWVKQTQFYQSSPVTFPGDPKKTLELHVSLVYQGGFLCPTFLPIRKLEKNHSATCTCY